MPALVTFCPTSVRPMRDMKPAPRAGHLTTAVVGTVLALAFPLLPSAAQAQTAEQSTLPASEPATPPPVLGPSLTGPLTLNPKPLLVDGGPLGPIGISGVVSVLGSVQSDPSPGDRHDRGLLTNGQLIVQSTEGPVQFYAQVGGYSIPTLGTPLIGARRYSRDTYGLVPVAYVKLVPSDHFSLQIGKLYTLQGAENAFSFQNFNVERGLLFNQTSTINRGVQTNVSAGRLSISVALTDGYYSKRYNWLSGTIGYAASPTDSVTLGLAANLGRTTKASFATPTVLNNGQLYFLSWTHTAGKLTLQPYVQVGHIPADPVLGIAHSVSTYGAALLGKYSLSSRFAVAARAEWIKSTGSAANGAPSLVYGPGSSAWSLTVTPTWQHGIFFVRPEASLVRAAKVAPGFGLGADLSHRSQVRGLVEAGIIF
ncbi:MULTISPECIES: outer membrane beta-barrel protein [Sphingomonas]|uniref:outer membrane beta-barrel protein n=1 Tax=Sphingomonas TaxID=13687 RepID=UPI0013B38FD2|nr:MULTISPECIES: outer membrane beta-barrel protein [Sphingomonas]